MADKQSAYIAGKSRARLDLYVGPHDKTHGDGTDNAPDRGSEQQPTDWTSRGPSEGKEGN